MPHISEYSLEELAARLTSKHHNKRLKQSLREIARRIDAEANQAKQLLHIEPNAIHLLIDMLCSLEDIIAQNAFAIIYKLWTALGPLTEHFNQNPAHIQILASLRQHNSVLIQTQCLEIFSHLLQSLAPAIFTASNNMLTIAAMHCLKTLNSSGDDTHTETLSKLSSLLTHAPDAYVKTLADQIASAPGPISTLKLQLQSPNHHTQQLACDIASTLTCQSAQISEHLLQTPNVITRCIAALSSDNIKLKSNSFRLLGHLCHDDAEFAQQLGRRASVIPSTLACFDYQFDSIDEDALYLLHVIVTQRQADTLDVIMDDTSILTKINHHKLDGNEDAASLFNILTSLRPVEAQLWRAGRTVEEFEQAHPSEQWPGLYCPITYGLLTVPFSISGATESYQRSAAISVVSSPHPKNPLSNAPLINPQITLNRFLQTTITDLVDRWDKQLLKKAARKKRKHSASLAAGLGMFPITKSTEKHKNDVSAVAAAASTARQSMQ